VRLEPEEGRFPGCFFYATLDIIFLVIAMLFIKKGQAIFLAALSLNKIYFLFKKKTFPLFSFLYFFLPLWPTYQSIVFFSPSSKPTLALNPNSFSALDTSSILLGWPSGLVVSQIIFPL